MRFVPLATLLLTSVSLGACATAWKPPEISYDDTPRRAVLQPDPPKPVRIVVLPWRALGAQASPTRGPKSVGLGL